MSTVTVPPETQQTAQAPPTGWYADPAGRHAARYWDGRRWTEYVADQGRQSTDPPEMATMQPVRVVPPPVGAPPQGPPPTAPVSRPGEPKRAHPGRWIVLVVALLVGLGALLSTIDTTDTESPAGDGKSDAASEQAKAVRSAKRAEGRLYDVLAQSRDTATANVGTVRGDVSPRGEVPGSIWITAPTGSGGDAGEIAEDNARDATRSIRIAEGKLQRAWRKRASDLRSMPSAVRTRYKRAYQAQLQYLRDAKAFTAAGATFLDGWNKITYLQQRYLVSGKWERYKQTSDTAGQSRTKARKALTLAHQSFGRAIKRQL